MTGRADATERLRAWTFRRQRLSGAAASPVEALGDVVAVYSSHPTAPLALLCRSAALDAKAFAALEERREAVRLPAMRGSVFLMPADDAPRIVAATREPIEKRAANLRYAGLDWDQYAALKPRVLELTRQPIGANALQQALPVEGRLMTVVRLMSREGLILRLGGSLRTDSLRYVAAEAWLGRPLEEADPDQSLIWLAEAYLRGYGPARVADFAWWSGAPRRRAAAALAATGAVDLGDGLLLPADQRDAFARVEPLDPDAVDILPKWDAYTMGHAPDGRQRLVDDEYLGRAYSTARTGGAGATSGDGLPLVLRGGRAVASWSHRFAGDRMLVAVTPFEPAALPPLDQAVFADAARLLGATRVEIT